MYDFVILKRSGLLARWSLPVVCVAIGLLGSGVRLWGETYPAPVGALAATEAKEVRRAVSIGGAITETLYALGAEKLLVGVDTSSTFPAAAAKLPQCGYQRTIAAEGVLSLKPDIVFLAGTAGPESAVKQIESGGVKTVKLGDAYTLEGARERILQVASAIGKKEAGKALAEKIGADVARKLVVPAGEPKPRVLFLMSRGGGAMILAGKGTAADAMIALAGGVNPASESFGGYKPISAEALVAYDPEVIVTTSRTFAEVGEAGVAQLLPGVSLTAAGGKGKQLVVLDDLYLLGFGPRVGLAVAELSHRIHGKSFEPVGTPALASGAKK